MLLKIFSLYYYLDNFTFDAGDGFGGSFDERKEQPLAQLFLRFDFQVSVHEQLKAFVVNVLQCEREIRENIRLVTKVEVSIAICTAQTHTRRD